MRRLMSVVLSVGFFCAAALLYPAIAGSAEKTQPTKGTAAAIKVTKMKAAGVVTEISATTLKIERKVKDKAETMEFALEKPVAKIKAGDKVKVSYITKDNQNVATKVTEDVPQKAVKKAKKVEGKALAPAGK